MEEEWGEQEPEGRGQKEGKKRKGKDNPHYEMRSKSLMTLTDMLC